MAVGITNQEIVFQAAGKIANHTDTLNKTFKVSEQFFKLISLVSSLFTTAAWMASGTGCLVNQFKKAKTVINSFNVLERFSDWGIAENRKKILSRWQKAASRICLTVAQFFETGLFIDKCTIRFFCQASLTVGKLPIFEGIKNFLYLGSTIFGLLNSREELAEASDKIQKSRAKRKKWENFVFDDETIKALHDKYKNKRFSIYIKDLKSKPDKLKKKILACDAKLPTLSRSKQNKLREKMKKYLTELSGLKTKSAKVDKYKGYLKAIEKKDFQSIKNHKIEKYKVRERNNRRIREKSWIAIASDIGKFVMIILGTMIGFTCLAYPALTTTAAAIIVTALSLTSNALGLTKNLYGFLGPKQENEPVYQYHVEN